MVEVDAVTPLEGHWLRLTLSNGDVVERDVQDLLTGGVLEPVRERREIFEAAFIDGGTVTWPGGVDIAPETLIWNGPEPRFSDARPAQEAPFAPRGMTGSHIQPGVLEQLRPPRGAVRSIPRRELTELFVRLRATRNAPWASPAPPLLLRSRRCRRLLLP